MSMTVRISDEVGEEIRMIKPDDMSFSKAAETILRLAVKALYREENENNDSCSSDDSNESFPEKLKKISEFILSKTYDEDEIYKIESDENRQSDFEESENENSKIHMQDFEKQISDFQKSEEHFLKIENELSEISKLIFENHKFLDEKIQSTEDD